MEDTATAEPNTATVPDPRLEVASILLAELAARAAALEGRMAGLVPEDVSHE